MAAAPLGTVRVDCVVHPRAKPHALLRRHRGPCWDGIRAQVAKPAAYTECEEAADKLAAHLTYGRADYRAQGFPPSQKVTDHLLGLALAFVTALPPEHRALFGRVLG
ncbi:MAG: hypothetical protein DMD25_14220 [Gemmatimonadetes bacterium]|nr:MAG: hypothetical protein DMD25_14220 [Gemmatimonadota bacterium]